MDKKQQASPLYPAVVLVLDLNVSHKNDRSIGEHEAWGLVLYFSLYINNNNKANQIHTSAYLFNTLQRLLRVAEPSAHLESPAASF